MSTTIGIIVHGRNQEEAFKKGKEALDQLVKKGRFRYYMTFDTRGKDYKDRCHRLPAVVLVSNPKGFKFILDRWEMKIKVFMEDYKRIKLAIKHLTPLEIMEETTAKILPANMEKMIAPARVRVFFYRIGNRGEGIPIFSTSGMRQSQKRVI